jgi:hypothetical protein
MKKLTLLSVLMIAFGINAGGTVASSNEAVPDAHGGASDIRPVYKYGVDHEIHELKTNYKRKNLSLLIGQADEVEMKRLRVMFLLLMSLAQHPSPIR